MQLTIFIKGLYESECLILSYGITAIALFLKSAMSTVVSFMVVLSCFIAL